MTPPRSHAIPYRHPEKRSDSEQAHRKPLPGGPFQPELYSKRAYGGHTAEPPLPLKTSAPINDRPQQKNHQKLKRILRIGKIVTKALTTIFATIMFASTAYTTITYQLTKGIFVNGRTAWPTDPKLWPTFMFLAVSGVTLVLSFITLFSYCCCYKKARTNWKLTIVKYAIHIGVWIIVSTLYRVEQGYRGNNNDLWGWSCSDEADAIQNDFKGIANFNVLCHVQTDSWGVSLTEIAVKVMFAISHFLLYRKTRDDEKNNLADGLGDAATGLLESF